MPRPPARLTALLLGTLVSLLLVAGAPPSAAASDGTAGEFYARMLGEHGGVFVEEELAGALDREAVMGAVRGVLAAHEASVHVLVVSPQTEYEAQYLAREVVAVTGGDLLLLSADSTVVRYEGGDGSVFSPQALAGVRTSADDPRPAVETLRLLLGAAGAPGAPARRGWEPWSPWLGALTGFLAVYGGFRMLRLRYWAPAPAGGGR